MGEVLALGCLRGFSLVLVAVGFALVFGSCRVLNLMHGAYVMIGAYSAHVFTVALTRTTAPGGGEAGSSVAAAAMLLAAAASGLFGFAFFKLLQVTRRTGSEAVLAISFTGNLFIAQLVKYAYGTEGVNVAPILRGSVSVGNVFVPASDLLIPPVAIAAVVLLWVWLRHSRSGMALRAVADDPAAATLMGINADRALAQAVGLAAFLAGLAGALAAPTLTLTPDMWVHPLLVSFAVVVLGGRGSLWGAVVTAFLLGIMETATGWLVSEALSQYVALVLVVVGLFVMPTGLAGSPQHELR